jgi:integrase
MTAHARRPTTGRRDPGDGGIDARGPDRWRLRYRVGGKRYTLAFHGTITEAKRELRRVLKSADDGMHVAPERTTLAEYIRGWLDNDADLSPKTLERYRQLAEQQIIPHLGAIVLQNLRPAKIGEWHGTLLKSGGKSGRPLSARTVGHAHRVLHRALERALRLEIVSRNVTASLRPPKVEAVEVEILTAEQMVEVLAALDGHPLHPIVSLALGTGMRRGELCALAWSAVDLDRAAVRVERSLEETAAGLRFKSPKTRSGHRTVSLPTNVVATLRGHRLRQIEQRLALGVRTNSELVFARPDATPYPPDKLSRDWGNVVRDRHLPRVRFHALRHSHASALIAANFDVVTVSQRLGHASPAITLTVYAHKFGTKDVAAADAIDAAMSGVTPAR